MGFFLLFLHAKHSFFIFLSTGVVCSFSRILHIEFLRLEVHILGQDLGFYFLIIMVRSLRASTCRDMLFRSVESNNPTIKYSRFFFPLKGYSFLLNDLIFSIIIYQYMRLDRV